MSCCEQSTDGSGGSTTVTCGTPICIDQTTVGAGVVTIPIGTLTAVGSAITFRVILDGAQNDGVRGLFFGSQGNAARSAIGSNTGFALAIGPFGYTDAVLVPWTTIGVPVGWAAAVGLVATVLNLTFNAAAGQTVHWRGMVERWAHNGATLA